MEPIAKGIAARGHVVHLVLPWHPRLQRTGLEDGVHFHPFRYAPHPALNVFGYAGALREDVNLRWSAYLAAPLAMAAGWRALRQVAGRVGATMLHGHWLIPNGVVVSSAGLSLPVVVSLHGSDVFVAERLWPARHAAQRTFGRIDWITACSHDLGSRTAALGAAADRITVIPYGVDASRFCPDPASREAIRRQYGIAGDVPVLFTAGRFVRKKGFEHLIDAVAGLTPRWPKLRLLIAGGGDLEEELRARARQRGVAERVHFVGVLAQGHVAAHLAAADIAVMPSVHDEAGNVDGLPNTVLEAFASGTPLVATRVGGIPSVVTDGRTGVLVPERDSEALANAIDALAADPGRRAALGLAAREESLRERTWERVAEQFEVVYERAACRAEERHASVKDPESRP
jgi:glycosyltransferase involved in cell wall biosynthesis